MERRHISSFFRQISTDTQDHEFWIAILDMDHFKTVNDTHGHNCGDQVLISLAALMRSRLTRARLCRWGGEEFLIAGRREEGDPLPVLEKRKKSVSSRLTGNDVCIYSGR